MPNLPVGLRHALSHLRPDTTRPATLAASLRRRSLALLRRPGRTTRRAAGAHRATPIERDGLLGSVRHALLRRPGRVPVRLTELGGRLLARERAVPLAVAGLVLVASMLSVSPAAGLRPSVGGSADPAGATPRLLAGGGVLGAAAPALVPATAAPGVLAGEDGTGDTALPSGPYLADGTLLKPVAVDTSVPDASDQLRTYVVAAGDTLTGIADRFGLSMMTIWWANRGTLTSPAALHIGTRLVIPPVDGLVVTVAPGDTLESIAAAAAVDPAVIADYNDLIDGTVVIGQTLVVPGGTGAAIPTPTPRPTPKPAARPAVGTTRTAPSYTGSFSGRLAWPVPGGYISQYYHPGHLAIDIAAPMGTPVLAGAAGRVVFAGWRNNGGGWQVWLSHGGGLFTACYHMSSLTVVTGQSVGRGQQVGRIGMTGWATGPHTHYEVWIGGVDTGYRVNPLSYLR